MGSYCYLGGALLYDCKDERGSHIVIWDVDTGRTRHNIRGFRKMCDLAIFPDGRTLLVAKGTGSGGPFTHPGENAAVLYDVATGKMSCQLATFSREKPVSKVALTLDGRFVLAVVRKGDIYRWKLEDRKRSVRTTFAR